MDQDCIIKASIIKQFIIFLTKTFLVMKPTHIEHIGIAVQSLDEAIPFYEKVLGLKCYAIEEV